MLPNTYKKYAGVFDLFSNRQLSPLLAEFSADVLARVPECALVCDVGAGTGYWTEQVLEQKKTVKMTIIEPAPEMLAIAKKRLARFSDRITYFETPFEDALSALPEQDFYIFQRSLYCLYGGLEPYKKLAARLAKKTSPQGRLAIYEIPAKYDIQAFSAHCLSNLRLFGLSLEEFQKNWETMERILLEFNANVDEGRFTLFDEAKIIEIFSPGGFALEYKGSSSFFLKKKATSANS